MLSYRFGTWVVSWMRPGLGMFNESYYIFSVGNVKPIWREQYPSCWKVCPWQAVCQHQPMPDGGKSGFPSLFCLRGLWVSAYDFNAPAAVSCADAQLL